MDNIKGFTVYALADPDGTVRYVGCTSGTVSHRMSVHRSYAKGGSNVPALAWFRSLQAAGIEPTVLVLERGFWTNEEAGRKEREWIEVHSRSGHLLNRIHGPVKRTVRTPSGRQGKKYGPQSPEHIAKRLATMSEPERREAWKKNHAEAMADPTVKEKLSEAAKSQWADPEKRKRAMATGIHAATPEERTERARRAAAAVTPEGRRRQSEHNTRRAICPDCGKEYNPTWMVRHKDAGRCLA